MEKVMKVMFWPFKSPVKSKPKSTPAPPPQPKKPNQAAIAAAEKEKMLTAKKPTQTVFTSPLGIDETLVPAGLKRLTGE